MVITMNIILSNTIQQPIYEQIYSQIRDQILSGELPCDTMLPSIRNLAKDLRISVITTKRAYEELERSGYIVTVAGKGCFVARPDTDRIRAEYRQQICTHLNHVLQLAPAAGLSPEDLHRLLDDLSQKEAP